MTRYLLDTAPLAAVLQGRSGAISLVGPLVARHEAATSIVVYGEVLEYIKGMPASGHYQPTLLDLLRVIRPYFLTYPIMDRYADLRRALRPPHGPGLIGDMDTLIGDMDTLIAATALEHGLILVTTDADFRRVPGLSLQLLSAADLRRSN